MKISNGPHAKQVRAATNLRWSKLLFACSAVVATLFSVGCSRKKSEEPVVNVQVAEVAKKSLQRRVEADAILFPLQQASIVPKIAAPVKKFLVKRGSLVRKGQLLAVLENRDLAAATDRASPARQPAALRDLPRTGRLQGPQRSSPRGHGR